MCLRDGKATWAGATDGEPQVGGSTSPQGFCGRGDVQEGPSKGRWQSAVWYVCIRTGKEQLVWDPAPGPQSARDVVFPFLPVWCPLSRWVRRMLTWPSS